MNIESGDMQIKEDELLLDIFDNILNNAVIHNKNKEKQIKINIFHNRKNDLDYIQFEFIDNGMSINVGRKKKIFESIFNNPALKEGGMGIGLSLVKKIIDSYEGKFWVENRVKGYYSKGSKFIILIPQV
ncbi:MAG: ATP-binding protein [Promethearchaeota archaeon]|nr:MAG: ATP-binding protein [Candidatus Lokiarchaeota archaeon]